MPTATATGGCASKFDDVESSRSAGSNLRNEDLIRAFLQAISRCCKKPCFQTMKNFNLNPRLLSSRVGGRDELLRRFEPTYPPWGLQCKIVTLLLCMRLTVQFEHIFIHVVIVLFQHELVTAREYD